MPVGRQQLQSLQSERADQYGRGNQKYALGVGQTERQPDHRKRREMFKLRARNDWTVIDRG